MIADEGDLLVIVYELYVRPVCKVFIYEFVSAEFRGVKVIVSGQSTFKLSD